MNYMKSVLGPIAKPILASVIICTLNRDEETLTCVKSILRQNTVPYEIIIVDATIDNLLYESLSKEVDKCNLIYLKSKKGLTIQRNVGINAASGNVYIFLDDDVVLEDDYISSILEIYEKDLRGEIAGVQGSFIGVKPYKWYANLYRRFFLLPGFTGLGIMQASGFPSLIALPKKITEVEMFCGGNASYRKEIFSEFKFNEEFKGYAYMEDDDFSYPVAKKYKLVQSPAAKLTHHHSSSARDSIIVRQRMDFINHFNFFYRRIYIDSKISILPFIWSEIGLSLMAFYFYGYDALHSRLSGLRFVMNSNFKK